MTNSVEDRLHPSLSAGGCVRVDIAVPVFNEERELERNVRRLRQYLDDSIPFPCVVTIVDNASTDRTWTVASALSSSLPGVRVLHLDEKGRGRALRAAWSSSGAEVVAYMDVDLSTDLNAFLPLVAPLLSGHSDLAIGSRLARGARVVRGPRRELISRSYNLILRVALRNRFSDAQCGFKALRADQARALLPAVIDEEWFFDTELLVLAERNGLRIHEVPVDWHDDPDSRVQIAATALADVRGIGRLALAIARGGDSLVVGARVDGEGLVAGRRFASVGVVSTAAYLGVVLVLLRALGGFGANALGLATTGAVNAFVHDRLEARGRGGVTIRDRLGGALIGWCTSLALTSLALGVVRLVGWRSTTAIVTALLLGTAAAAAVRFAVFAALGYRAHLRRLAPVVSTAPTEG